MNVNILMDVVAEPNSSTVFTGATGIMIAVVAAVVIAVAAAVIIRAVNKKNKGE